MSNNRSRELLYLFQTHLKLRLRRVHWNLAGDALSKVIWALDSLPCLITPAYRYRDPSAILSRKRYAYLCCIGFTPLHIQLATTLITTFHDNPDVVVFLATHGLNLVVLDLNLNVDPLLMFPRTSISAQLLLPSSFNADWRGRS